MFFSLEAISDHPCCKMQELVEHFFFCSIDEARFSSSLFSDWIRSTLASKSCTLDADFKKVHDLLHDTGVSRSTRQAIYEAVKESNEIQEICEGWFNISEDVIEWYGPLGLAIWNLMDRLYDSMDLAVFRRHGSGDLPRKQLYGEFIKKNKYVCPFCSIGKFKNKLGNAREGFDHFLCRSSYPLSSANMKNLVPTCGTCNEDYKKAKDVLADGAIFYPYAKVPEVEVTVDCISYPAVNRLDDRGKWSVEISPSTPNPNFAERMKAWDRVYCVKERLNNEVSEFFEDWMKEVAWGLKSAVDEAGLRSAIADARDKARDASLRRMEPNQIIRAAFFDFLITRAEQTFLLSFRDVFNAGLRARTR